MNRAKKPAKRKPMKPWLGWVIVNAKGGAMSAATISRGWLKGYIGEGERVARVRVTEVKR